ncbi:sulfurtransferase [Algiphilus sp. NNCM1]|uniref:rhodanese-like domain-containing protein n=1 Tax=Algiphilus sp. TaxID=1872431 RepID=UPI001CA62E13|nr:rhodanese-like domain-containing protein [Algiphilus sp.]MBY8965674.1 sulfurtransferase [Algiphilus acroporae]MCI5061739.1 sulfurtransferase [Algiphilus sp.]MCI5104450.1 sulfurtransferase [Algiphilus sp.]
MEHSKEFVALVDAARARILEIDASELATRLAKAPEAVLIDVREESEYAAGHVRGAEHIGKGVIERDILAKHPDKTQPLYLYCGGGYRSALAADALGQMGYERAVSVDGGWRALREIMPTE